MIDSLRKPKRTLRQVHKLYLRKSPYLTPTAKETLQTQLNALRDAILIRDKSQAKKLSRELEETSGKLMPKTIFDKFFAFVFSMSFALLVAVLIRTMWFELYTIPSGSMRPTLKEDDYLIVSKTDYGINVPLQEAHFYFDPELVKRGSIVVFNGANIDLEDSDTTYFYLFPGKKQFVKRLVGIPGDTLYFYGGNLYGVDKEGEAINLDAVNQIEHIPMIRFDGRADAGAPQNGKFPNVLFRQMNQPLAKLSLNTLGTISGSMIGKPAHFSDFLGMKHFAMARLLNKAEAEKIHGNTTLEEAPLYLELTHHPKLQGANWVRDEYNRLRPDLSLSTSLIPLQKEHIEQIAAHMTTCRFSVNNGAACRLGWNPKELAPYLPQLNVANGTYEIQDGKVYSLPFPTLPLFGIFTNGYIAEVAKDHPLYSTDPALVQKLYNFGIEFLNHYGPSHKGQRAVPSRYAYFKDGDLHLMGAPIMKKEDPTLQKFIASEKEKEKISTTQNPYFAFADAGMPSMEEIRKNGVTIPEKMYMVLGDNHAMSADSRHFGFVPEENLKGGASFIFAPIDSRLGLPNQPATSHATFPNLTVWIAFFLIMSLSSRYYNRQLQKPLHLP